MAIPKISSALVVAIVLALGLIVLPGCAQSAPESEAVSENVAPEVLGPYPMNVRVECGHISLTLESVRVLASDSPPGSFIYRYSGTGEATSAPIGSRFVDVTVRIEGADSKYSTGGFDLFDNPVVLADGTTIPVGARATVIDDASSFAAEMEFAVPDATESAILHLPLSVESSEVASFRLW